MSSFPTFGKAVRRSGEDRIGDVVRQLNDLWISPGSLRTGFRKKNIVEEPCILPHQVRANRRPCYLVYMLSAYGE